MLLYVIIFRLRLQDGLLFILQYTGSLFLEWALEHNYGQAFRSIWRSKKNCKYNVI